MNSVPRRFLSVRSPLSVAAALAVFMFLAGCANIQLSEPYDPEIEKTLNSYHEGVVAFVKKMELSAGTPEGAFGNPKVQDFYAAAEGQLSNLIVRAEAANPSTQCTPAGVAKAIPPYLRASNEQLASTDANPEEVSLADGNCTVVVLESLLADQRALEDAHRRHEFLRPPVSTQFLEFISDGVRIALLNETGKK